MIVIQPQYLSLAKLLAGRLFRIPEYQRAYSWTSVQRRDLFGDIQKVHEKGPDEGHFMAAVVCLRRGKQALGTDEFDQVEIRRWSTKTDYADYSPQRPQAESQCR